MRAFKTLVEQAGDEIKSSVSQMDPAELDKLVEALAGARRIALHGVGREGLMMRALTMRLFHMGLDAHVVGDMTTPPLGKGDLLVVSAGPGAFATVAALVGVARDAGALTAAVTAQRSGAVPTACDLTLTIPAQTMADDDGADHSSVLPMGSLYEGAQYLAFEVLVIALRERLGISAEAMRANHTNLE